MNQAPAGLGTASQTWWHASGPTPAAEPVALVPGAQGSALGATYWRALRWFAAARIVLAVLSFVFLLVSADQMQQRGLDVPSFVAWIAGWLLFAVLMAQFLNHVSSTWFYRLLTLQLIADDAVIFALLRLGEDDVSLGALYLLPVAAAAVLLEQRWAFTQGAVATLLILVHGLAQTLDGGDARPLVAAGFSGAAYFALGLVVSRLAGRLAGQEALAEQRGIALLTQLDITAAALAELDTGVLVFDQHGRLQSLNPAASQLFGLPDGVGVDQVRERLAKVTDIWLQQPELTEIRWRYADANGQPCTRVLRLRRSLLSVPVMQDPGRPGMPAAPDANIHAATLLFLSDRADAERQAQQLKLAAMGRLTASIAHEIRNPLAAVRQAGQLLAEDLQAQSDDPTRARLLRIIDNNVLRINQIVEDVLSLSRREPVAEHVQLADAVQACCRELQEAGHRMGNVQNDVPATLVGMMDPSHLRRIVINVLGNALRYASDQPGAIQLRAALRDTHWLELAIGDDGPGLTDVDERQVFEPFFTTSAQGTGLGLYLARELAVANQAQISFVRGHPAGRVGAFVLVMRCVPADPQLPMASTTITRNAGA